MRKLSLSSAQWLREMLHASVKTFCEPHFLHWLHCVLLVAKGRSCYEVARWFGDDPRTIERWVHALDEYGIEGLREHHAGGRPAKLAGGQLQRLAFDLQRPPRVFGYSESRWSGKLLTQYVEGRYGVKLSARQCQRIMRQLADTGCLGRLDALAMRQQF